MILLVQSVMYQAREKGNNLRKDYVTNSAKLRLEHFYYNPHCNTRSMIIIRHDQTLKKAPSTTVLSN